MRRMILLTLLFVLAMVSGATLAIAQDTMSVAPATIAGFPLQTLLGGLSAILAPVLSSGIVWFLNKRTTIMEHWPNALKQSAYFIMGVLGSWLGTRYGLDLSSVPAFAASVLSTVSGFALFHLGKSSPASKA